MLKQKFLVQFGSNIGLQLLGMIGGIFVARLAGPEVVGTIVFGRSYVQLFVFILGIWSTSHIKLVSEREEIGNCVSTYTKLQFGSILAFIIIFCLWFILHFYFLDFKFDNDTHIIVIFIFFLGAVANSLLTFSNTTFLSKLKQVKANYLVFFRGVFYNLGRIIVVILGFEAIALASIDLVTMILFLPLAYVLYKKLPKGNFNKQLAKDYVRYAVPILGVVFINSVIKNSDKVILQYFTNSTELGYYAAAFSLGGLVILIGKNTGLVFFPLFSSYISKNDWNNVNDKIEKYQKFLAISIFPAVCVIFLIANPFLILILGNKYLPSVIPFKIIIFASYILIFGIPFGNVITGAGKFNLNLIINILELILYSFSIFIFLSPEYLNLGAIGLAINLVVVYSFRIILFYIFARKIGKIHLFWKNYFIHFIILLLTLIFYFLFQNIVLSPSLAILEVALFLTTVYLSLTIVRLLKKDDIRFIMSILDINKIINYIKKEYKND